VDRRRVYGMISKEGVPGSDESSYRPVWDMGRTTAYKRKSRRRGINRPSV